MKDIFYQMKKAAWDCATGGYTATERVTDYLTLAQVRARVARLPDSTIHFWGITMYCRNEESEGAKYITGEISAEEFDGDVPVFP